MEGRHCLSDKDTIYWLAPREGYASAASHLADGAYNRQLSFLLEESSVIQNGKSHLLPWQMDSASSSRISALDEIGKSTRESSISLYLSDRRGPKKEMLGFLPTNVLKVSFVLKLRS